MFYVALEEFIYQSDDDAERGMNKTWWRYMKNHDESDKILMCTT